MDFSGCPAVANHLFEAALPTVDAIPAAGEVNDEMLLNARVRSVMVAAAVGAHGPDGSVLATSEEATTADLKKHELYIKKITSNHGGA